MECKPDVLKHVPLFSMLDDEEIKVLAGQVELSEFHPRQRIYKIGDPNGLAYVMVTGRVRVTTIDEDQQEVVVDEPSHGEFFGFASMLEQTPHQTTATAIDETDCIEVMRNVKDIIEQDATLPQREADTLVRIGGSWAFIIGFAVITAIYTAINTILRRAAWDPYPYILLNLILSLLAAIQAPVIMMSQNRQDMKDRLRNELDYSVNRRAETEIQALSRKLNLLGEQMGDMEEMLRHSVPPRPGSDFRAHV